MRRNSYFTYNVREHYTERKPEVTREPGGLGQTRPALSRAAPRPGFLPRHHSGRTGPSADLPALQVTHRVQGRQWNPRALRPELKATCLHPLAAWSPQWCWRQRHGGSTDPRGQEPRTAPSALAVPAGVRGAPPRAGGPQAGPAPGAAQGLDGAGGGEDGRQETQPCKNMQNPGSWGEMGESNP